MKKIVFLILALAIAWAIPGVRNRIGVAVLPVLERLGPVGEKLANPARAFKARNQLAFFLRIINDDRTEARALPEDRTFTQWVRGRMPQESGIDPWGNPYWLRRRGTTFMVGTDGPDGVRDTADGETQVATF
jgi:hypothetical protein